MKGTDASPSPALQRLRLAANLTQQEVADWINARSTKSCGLGSVTAHMVSRWERGAHSPNLQYRRLLADLYGVPVARLGLLDPHIRVDPLSCLEEPAISPLDPRVGQSQQAWMATRRGLNAHRCALTHIAAATYPAAARLDDTGLLTGPGWIPGRPVSLDAVSLDTDPDSRPAIDGTEPTTSHVRPHADLIRLYPRYTAAVRDLDPPRLFENRLSWRLTGVEWEATKGELRFCDTTYFAGMDVCEALAHEMAYVCLNDHSSELTNRTPALRDLPFRRLLGDPFDSARRNTLTSVSTLTIRGGQDPTFLLHRRDSRNVAIAGGMLHVIPSGIFQPSSVLPAAVDADFDLWRNLIREYAEELLGFDEANGDGRPVDYTAEPFAELDAAYAAGRVRVWALGVAVDALTLATEILTVAVLDPDLFDALAVDFVPANAEGTIVNGRLPFDEHTVGRVLGSGRMAPAAAGCLRLAWQHHAAILP